MKRLFHHYNKWEDEKHGFYELKNNFDLSIIESMFNCELTTEKYMNRVVDEWTFSCEQNLTNKSMNTVAYIGQAASCLFCGASSIATMKAWNLLSQEVRDRADKQALECIIKWKKRYKNTLIHGGVEDISNQYLMKFQSD